MKGIFKFIKLLLQSLIGSQDDIIKEDVNTIEVKEEENNKSLKKLILEYIEENNIILDEILLIGIRDSSKLKKDVINDYLGYITRNELFLAPGTTDPGVYYYENPMNDKGTFHLKTKFHKNIWCFGKHRGYEALVNDWRYCLPTEGWRDANFNFEFDEDDITVKGHYGINFHRMHPINIVNKIGRYSAGCQVVQDPKHFEKILNRCKQTNKYKSPGKSIYSYLLLDIRQIPNGLLQRHLKS